MEHYGIDGSPLTMAAVMARPVPALLSAALPFAHIGRAFDMTPGRLPAPGPGRAG